MIWHYCRRCSLEWPYFGTGPVHSKSWSNSGIASWAHPGRGAFWWRLLGLRGFLSSTWRSSDNCPRICLCSPTHLWRISSWWLPALPNFCSLLLNHYQSMTYIAQTIPFRGACLVHLHLHPSRLTWAVFALRLWSSIWHFWCIYLWIRTPLQAPWALTWGSAYLAACSHSRGRQMA